MRGKWQEQPVISWRREDDAVGITPLDVLDIVHIGTAVFRRSHDEPGAIELMAFDPYKPSYQDPENSVAQLAHWALIACRSKNFELLQVTATTPNDAAIFTAIDPSMISFELVDEDPRGLPDLKLSIGDLVRDFAGTIAQLPPDLDDHPQRSIVIRAQL